MAVDNSHPQGIDLDRTDRLPILEGVTIDDDVADDSVRLDNAAGGYSADAPDGPRAPPHPPAADFARPGVDLPSLAESMRSVEQRIARQSADYEALNRLYEKARDAQLAAGTRADALASELSQAHSALAVEQHRAREMERALSGGAATAEAARARVEEALREAERHQIEARTLRDALSARDATIAQVLHSLGERDAQLFALQREHAQTVPVLEARSKATARLQSDLEAARANAESLSVELNRSQAAVSSLTEKLARGEAELAAARRDLSAAGAREASHLELLRTREWRGAFNQNLFREWDDEMDAARSGEGALRAELDCLRQSAASMTARLAEQDAAISRLEGASAAYAAELEAKAHDLGESRRLRTDQQARVARLESECSQLREVLQTRSQELAAERQASADEAHRIRDAHAAAETRHAELHAQLEQLRTEAATHEDELAVLMAHLNEARRPIQSIQADLRRLTDEVALKNLSIDQLTEENQTLRAGLERTRGALEERELHIRRLERSANNSANVLGRLQTSIERLGSVPPPPLAGEFLAELVKIEGDARTAYPLGRRTRIGRAPGCELQIDSQSVSRHHALLLKGTREIIVEDLNSTNGVLVNGRKVTRHVLSDGDLLTIGETQFQCRLRPNSRAPEVAKDPAGGAVHPVGEAAAGETAGGAMMGEMAMNGPDSGARAAGSPDPSAPALPQLGE